MDELYLGDPLSGVIEFECGHVHEVEEAIYKG